MPDLSLPCFPCQEFLRSGSNPENIYFHFISHFPLISQLPGKCISFHNPMYTEELLHHLSCVSFSCTAYITSFCKISNMTVNIAQFGSIGIDTNTIIKPRKECFSMRWIGGPRLEFSKNNRIKMSRILICWPMVRNGLCWGSRCMASIWILSTC